MNTKSITTLLFSGLFCAAAILLLSAQPADAGGKKQVVTQFRVPLMGTTLIGSEQVEFTGIVHMTVVIPTEPTIPGNPVRVQTNLSGVTGIGRSTGLTYRATGAAQTAFQLPVAGQFAFTQLFSISPARLIPTEPMLPVQFSLNFDGDGQVTSADATVGSNVGTF